MIRITQVPELHGGGGLVFLVPYGCTNTAPYTSPVPFQALPALSWWDEQAEPQQQQVVLGASPLLSAWANGCCDLYLFVPL